VEREPATLLDVYLLPANCDALSLRVYLHAEGGGFPVYLDLAFLYQLLGSATRGDSRTGECPLEPHFRHDSAST
jgi:hypothetical protein